MIVSEARQAANRLNGAKGQGPSSPEGRAISCRNSLKHGLTGKGLVVAEGDAEEIGRRVEALNVDMKPMSTAGVILIAQMATLSLRAERASEQESAAIALKVRHAADDFDEERIALADELFAKLGDDLRNNLRKLRKSPEGVHRLIEEWRDLRLDLTPAPLPLWSVDHLARAARLLGIKEAHAKGTRFGALSKGVWGDFRGLEAGEAAELDDASRRAWSKARLVEQIDAEIAALEAHYETLDFETIELDRAEAGDRARFDSSKAATLARRYEAEARRGFFKALKEFRLVEAEAAAQLEAAPAPPKVPPTPRAEAPVGSSREIAPPPDRESAWTLPESPMGEIPVVRGTDGPPLSIGRPPKTTG